MTEDKLSNLCLINIHRKIDMCNYINDILDNFTMTQNGNLEFFI